MPFTSHEHNVDVPINIPDKYSASFFTHYKHQIRILVQPLEDVMPYTGDVQIKVDNYTRVT